MDVPRKLGTFSQIAKKQIDFFDVSDCHAVFGLELHYILDSKKRLF